MLNPGQKVKVADKLRNTYDKDHKIAGGMITTIVSYAGQVETSKGLQDCYYVADCQYPITRRGLFPIDDEPCNNEFIEEFQELLNANNKV